jgi:hypothetical protein
MSSSRREAILFALYGMVGPFTTVELAGRVAYPGRDAVRRDCNEIVEERLRAGVLQRVISDEPHPPGRVAKVYRLVDDG